jgi:hypothetical protein
MPQKVTFQDHHGDKPGPCPGVWRLCAAKNRKHFIGKEGRADRNREEQGRSKPDSGIYQTNKSEQAGHTEKLF